MRPEKLINSPISRRTVRIVAGLVKHRKLELKTLSGRETVARHAHRENRSGAGRCVWLHFCPQWRLKAASHPEANLFSILMHRQTFNYDGESSAFRSLTVILHHAARRGSDLCAACGCLHKIAGANGGQRDGGSSRSMLGGRAFV